MKTPPPGPQIRDEGYGTTNQRSSAMEHRTPRAITLPPAAEVTVRRVDDHPALIVIDPEDGSEQVIRFAVSHPGDACTTISSLTSALKNAEGQYFDAELILEYSEVAS